MKLLACLRFRCWSLEDEVMEPVTQITYGCDGKTIMVITEHEDGHMGEPDKFVLMQCTGIKDSQGTLIYEGDILEAPQTVWVESMPRAPYHRIVIRDGSWFALVIKPKVKPVTKRKGDPYAPLQFSTYSAMRWTIIGNIYEDPELKP